MTQFESGIVSDVAITGASGFVGRRLCQHLLANGSNVHACVRAVDSLELESVAASVRVVSDITDAERWAEVFGGVDVVVHLAALVHQPRVTDPEAYRSVNVDGTRAVATAAVETGVRRIVFVSTIKVNGESTDYDRPFRADDPPLGSDPYALSKLEAERLLADVSRKSGIELVVVRPVLVYGPGVGGNFLRMLKLVTSGIPIPLGSIANRRSILYLDNLCELIQFSCHSSQAAGKVLLAADDEPLSTPELLRNLGLQLGTRPSLLKIPTPVLTAVGTLLGRREDVRRLCGSLHVDTNPLRELGWSQPISTEDGLAATGEWFMQARARE